MLFADVTGSTSLGERLDPERFQEVLGTYFAAMREEIGAEGGTVEKFVGDAVMAAFGVPAAHEDDPTRALRAALRMRRRLEEVNRDLSARHGVTLGMRIGINTGEVLAAVAPAPGEPMVTGDAVNVASRLQSSAEPDQVLVAERTARAARRFRFAEIDPLNLRGKTESVNALVLLGEKEAGDRGLPGLRAPLVGRDRELALLDSLFDRLAAEEHPNLLTVYGDAGIGKSRLIAEFLDRLAEKDPNPVVVRGRCMPYGEGVTYWPLAEILKVHAAILDTDTPALVLEKIRKLETDPLAETAGVDASKATAALAYTMGIEDPEVPLRGLEPREVRLKVHSAWRSFFSGLARRAPVVAVIEDVHWAEPSLLDLLEELAERVQGAVLFVCPARPELTEHRPGWGGGKRNFSSVDLDPLSAEEADRLVGLLLSIEDLPGPVHEQILERAEGNPFFLEEIIRHLIDEGRIAREGDRWRASGDIGNVVIPDTVQAVLAARIDLLGPAEKRALQSAAVVGRVFWPGPVRRLLDGDAGALDETLEHLENRDLILSRIGSAISDEPEFIFKHVLTREVAYESLPRRDRSAAHASVARWIEETAGERTSEFVELLAFHYSTALEARSEVTRADPATESELRAKSFEHLLAAAEDARSKLVSRKALRLAEKALGVAGDDLQRSHAQEAMGQACQDMYEGDLGWRYFCEAVDAAVAAGDDGARIAYLCARSCEIPTRWPGSMRSQAREEQVARYLELGMQNAPEGDCEERVRLLTTRSFWPFAFMESERPPEENEECRKAGEQAASMALRLGRPDLASAALDGAASFFVEQGLYGAAWSLVEKRLALAPDLEDPWEIGDMFAMASWGLFDMGDYRQAFESGDEGFRRTIQDAPAVAMHCAAWRVMARFALGDWDGLLADFDRIQELLGDRREDPPYFVLGPFAAAMFVHEVRGNAGTADGLMMLIGRLFSRGDSPKGTWVESWCALVHARRGEHAGAAEAIERAETLGRVHAGIALGMRCDLAAERGGWDEAPAIVAKARDEAERGGLKALPLHADRLEGRAALAMGDIGHAVELLRRARDGFRDLEARWEEATSALSLGEALAASGEADEARAVLSNALGAFERLQAVREKGRARELLSALGG